MLFVIYSNRDEAIITTVKDEKKTVKLYFTDGGRELDEYDREEQNDIAVHIESRLSTR